jgi:perosamine synthetase
MSEAVAAAVVATLDRLFAGRPRPIALHEPEFRGRERDYVLDCIDSGWVSTVGRYVDRFEGAVAETCGAPHAVAVVNGTAALHTCLMLAGVRPGDEVLVPALTFVATANSIAHAGAIPHFIDSEPASLGADPVALAAWLADIAEPTADGCRNRLTGRRIAALVVVHVFGHPVKMDALAGLAERHGLVLIEDAAESLGSLYHGRRCGGLARLAATSFNGNKIATCGGGGAVLTQDAELARAARHLTTTAKLPHPWAFHHDRVGWNYRLPNLNAALGLAQLERLEDMVARKRRLAAVYAEAFAAVPGVKVLLEQPDTRGNYWLNTLVLEDPALLEPVLAASHAAGFLCRPAWELLHRQPMYAACPRMSLATVEALAPRLLNLPSSPHLADPADHA